MKQQLKLTGILLSAQPVGEYDRRVVILTKEKGKITAFARGARRQGNSLMGVTEPFTYGTFTCYKGYDAYSLTAVEVTDYFDGLKHDLSAVCYATYFCELADCFTMEGTSDKTLLNLLYVTFRALMKRQMPYALIRSVYEWKLLEVEGVGLQVFQCVSCGKEIGQDACFLDVKSGGLLCGSCKQQGVRPQKLSPATLYTLQHIASSSLKVLYGFTVSDAVQRELDRIMKVCLDTFMDRTCKSLAMLESLALPDAVP